MAAISVPGGTWTVPLDIGVAACDHLGATPITSFQQNSKVAARLNFRYDKRRVYELQRNLWTFSARDSVIRPLDATSMQVTFGTWSATATYVLGSIALDPVTNRLYQALGSVPASANSPSSSPTQWQEYFGPQMTDVWTLTAQGGPANWAVGTNYAASVDVVASDGNVYLSLVNGNLGNNPVTDGGVHWMKVGPAPQGLGYFAGDIVYYPGTGPSGNGVYLSLQNNNVQQPNVIAAWVSTQTYNKSQTVTGSDSNVYQSVVDLNAGVNPVGDGGVHWVLASTLTAQADAPQGQAWLLLGQATLSSFTILYPLGCGPASDVATRNVFPLPYGWLRPAPQDPKGGQLTWLGGPANNVMNDWVYENGYLLSNTFTPIILRFGADVNNVAAMDAMFCEMMAAGLALDAVETVTNGNDKKQAIGQAYSYWGSEARKRNAIVQGPIQAEEDEYITDRR